MEPLQLTYTGPRVGYAPMLCHADDGRCVCSDGLAEWRDVSEYCDCYVAPAYGAVLTDR